MTKHHLPAGCHDAETAAQLLGMSKKALLQKMREMGWLNVSGESRNLPRRELVKAKFLCTQQRGYCLKGKKEIAKSYSVMLLTQAGFKALKTELEKEESEPETITASPTKIAPVTQPDSQENVVPFNQETADAARKKTIDHINQLLAS